MLSNIIALFLLILANGFFTASELAVLSVNHAKVRGKAEEGNKNAVLLKKILDGPNKFLATVQICISLCTLFTVVFAFLKFFDPLYGFLSSRLQTVSENIVYGLAVIIIVSVVSYLLLLFGEVVPKSIAVKHSAKIAPAVIFFINLISIAATPFVKILTVSSNAVLRLIGIDPNYSDEDVTEEEIRMLIDVGEEAGKIHEAEKEMIHNIFEFDNKTVDDIAVHRKDIVALSIDADKDEIVRIAVTERFSRIPVYEGNIDNIIGILHLKDFLNYIFSENRLDGDIVDLRSIIRKPYFVPLTKKTDKLFDEMKETKAHMAIVADEYGGTAGLVTMEDLIEEIMGSIYDEYDEEERPDIEQIYENTYCVNGTADLETVAEFFDAPLPVGDYDTISGFIVGQIGRIPNEGEQPEFEFNGLVFKAYEVTEMRVSTAIVSKIGDL